jgi:O-antigen/teichoic acid export membrane protein
LSAVDDPATESRPVDLAAPPETGLRRVAARGVVINSGFLVALGTLNLLKAVIVAGFLTVAEFGVWSIVVLAITFITVIKQVTVGDKYVQQDEPDQEHAFQKAFTLELGSAMAMMAVTVALAPVLALIYDEPELITPLLALALILPALALQSPIWVFYRRMDFLRQRLLAAVDPIVGFAVTIALAAAGLGYWSLIVGMVAGSWTGAAVAVAHSEYPLRLRFEGTTLRSYFSFSWPLVVAAAAGLGIAQLSVLLGDAALGLAGAGAIGLAATFAAYTDRVDAVITQALYPAICRVAERRELLFEAFTKSNRLALMWGVPFGVGLSLFAADLIEFGIGEQWSEALILLQVFGLTAAVNHIGFNWSAFYRASAQTRPIAVVNVLALAAFCATCVPLIFSDGLTGFAIGTAIVTAVALAARFYYLSKLFVAFEIARHVVRAIAPTVPAAAAVLLLRLGLDGERTIELALFELGVYLAVTALMTVLLERRLLAEARSYLRRPPRTDVSPA